MGMYPDFKYFGVYQGRGTIGAAAYWYEAVLVMKCAIC